MKKIFALLLVMVTAFGLVACKKDDPEDNPKDNPKDVVKIKVWGPAEEKVLFDEMTAAFKLANPDKEYEFTFGDVGEDKAKEEYVKDPDAAADVFMFANDQIQELNTVGALLEVQGSIKTDVTKRNVKGSVDSATIDDKLLALPLTADNGYFMYYDKSKLTADDVKTFDGILAKATSTNQFFFPFETGWYVSSFFLTVGDLEYIDGGLVNYKGTLADAQAAATAMTKYINNDKVVTKLESIGAQFAEGKILAGLSGTWDAKAVKEALGENYAAVKLPTATIGGAQKQLSSFAGYKLIGVNARSQHKEEALAYANFISNEANQVRRVEVRGSGPSNIKAQDSSAVTSDIALSALAQQSVFSKGQGVIPADSYWTPVEAFGVSIKAGDINLTNVNAKTQELLDKINRVTK